VNILTARNFKNKLTSGFTLVELLIVIALLGAIALIVIAAINPIEQANRARDTRFRSDGGQLISATDRYFAARSEFPWMTVTSTYSTDDAFGFAAANNQEVGICGATCAADGVLITNDELKTEFRSRDFVEDYDGSDASETIWIGKDSGSSSSVYACFIPLSNSERQNAVQAGNVYTISTADGTRTATTSCDADGTNWVTSGCYVCIPE
jgi:prepilin-type N-terminal cleavage/methylation domain-containing protein